jgi:multiple sugar transport system substrate-binding protein
MVLVNLKAYNALGYTEADYPATWDEFYDQLYEMRDKGFEYPYLPQWPDEWFGISYSFTWEVLNRGGDVAHPETHEPMVTVDGPAGDTLRDWKRVWNDGLIPEECIGYRQPEQLEAFGSGEYIYCPEASYRLERFNDPEYSTFAGYCSFIPYQGQPWGILDSAMYLMTNRERSPEHTDDVMRFFVWYGWKNQEGKTFVGQRWMNETMLFSAYKSVMESPETEAMISAVLPDPDDWDDLVEIYAHTPYPKGSYNVAWGSEFNSWLMEKLQKFLVDDLPVDETIDAITAKINELNTTFGIGE